MSTECAVLSPCGRYRVHLTCDETELRVVVDRHNKTSTSLSVDANLPSSRAGEISVEQHFSATLREAEVAALTTAAGVRKSFPKFADMMYHALIGRAPCLQFYVETCAELKRRISADVWSRRQPQQHNRQHTTAGALSERTTLSKDSVIDDMTDIELSVRDDLAGDILSQRFLTIDYDVDFTRAVFPIPLDPISSTPEAAHTSAATATGGTMRLERSRRASIEEEAANARRDVISSPATTKVTILEEELAHAADTIEQLLKENGALKEENRTLVRLSKEKMLEMQRLCEDFQSRVHATAEVERLRTRNAELRARLQDAETAVAAAERAMEEERRRCRAGLPAVSTPRRMGLDSQGTRRARTHAVTTTASGRGSSGGSPNPYLRSRSPASPRESVRTRTGRGSGSDTAMTATGGGPSPDRRPLSAHSRSRGRPLVSPTPPPSHTRRPVGRSGGGGNNRFDTPPNANVHLSRQRSRSQQRLSRMGGDSPAPRGRSGNRPLGDGTPVRKGNKGSPSPSLCGSSRASSVASSRPGSCSSHDRLYVTSTAASRQRQVPPSALPSDKHFGRPVFR